MKAGTGRRLGLSSRFPGGWDFGFIFILSDLYAVIALGSADYFFFPCCLQVFVWIQGVIFLHTEMCQAGVNIAFHEISIKQCTWEMI